MDTAPELIFLQVLSATLYSGYKGWKMFRKREPALFVVLSARKCGVSTSIRKVKEGVDGKVVLVDRDDIIESQPSELRDKLKQLMDEERKDSFDLLFYPIVKNHLKQCRKVFKNNPVVLFINDQHLVKYLQVPLRNVLTIIPSITMFQNLLEKYRADGQNTAANLLLKSREELIVSAYNKKLIKNWSDLDQLLSSILAIKK
jgi:hypothetical protein